MNVFSGLKVLLFFFSQAEVIKADLDKVLDYRGGLADDDGGVEPRAAQPDIKYVWTQPDQSGRRSQNINRMRLSVIVLRINLENIIGKHFRQPESYIVPQEKSPPPLPDFLLPQWREPGTGDLSLRTLNLETRQHQP